MKKPVVVFLILLFATPAYAQMDGVIGVSTFKGKTTILYAEYKMIAHAQAIYPEFEEIRQAYEDDGTAIFLLVDDAELATVKGLLTDYGITFDKETNVALTARQKALLDGTRITSRSQVVPILEKLEALDAATTFAAWKEESLKSQLGSVR